MTDAREIMESIMAKEFRQSVDIYGQEACDKERKLLCTIEADTVDDVVKYVQEKLGGVKRTYSFVFRKRVG